MTTMRSVMISLLAFASTAAILLGQNALFNSVVTG